jgi:hypothetical protein
MTQTTTDYGFRSRLKLPFGQALEKVTAALKEGPKSEYGRKCATLAAF